MSSIRGNICKHGPDLLFNRVLRGELSLDTLFVGLVLRCNQKEHNRMCTVLRLGTERFYRPAIVDVYNWVVENVDKLVQRPKLYDEVKEILAHTRFTSTWVTLWPLFQKSPMLKTLEKPVWLNCDISSLHSRVGIYLGLAKINPDVEVKATPNLSFVSHDALLYRSLIIPDNRINLKLKRRCGPAVGLYLATVYSALEPLPIEIKLQIIQLATGLSVTVDVLTHAANTFTLDNNMEHIIAMVSGSINP